MTGSASILYISANLIFTVECNKRNGSKVYKQFCDFVSICFTKVIMTKTLVALSPQKREEFYNPWFVSGDGCYVC